MTTPLVDLLAQNREVAREIEEGFARVIASGAFVQGPEVCAFESAFAAFSGARHCVGVASGTDAIELALRASGIGPGDEVILPANTFIATAEAVVRAGAVPVLVDCDPNYLLIDVDAVAKRIMPATKAVIPVHLFGQVAPMDALHEIAAETGVTIIEDAAQSHGARQHGRQAGTFGQAAAVSFYPGKNLGAYGDAGAVLTDSDQIAWRVRALGNHGSMQRYQHPELGFNSRLDSLQAVVLSAKLTRLQAWNEARASAAAAYRGMLADVADVQLPMVMPGNVHVWHLFVIRLPYRDQALAALHRAGIGAAIHYPVPIHLHGAFSYLGHRRGDFPVAEAAAATMLSLPIYPHITIEQQAEVVELVVGAA
ncbi:MAG TPA: DegT/DnrJ/EryC1/StrS family aminotransferase [Actinomycetota bacterium]|nr:DegT/DnrJ/EryC1/StrS family aminotransferase [Actinomycetota bacterium]